MIFAGLTLVSRLAGFVRDQAVAYYIGASQTLAGDAYNTALAFPNLFRRIFAEGAFAAAFVPAYSKTLKEKGEEAADHLATEALATVAMASVVLVVLAQLGMPWIMRVYSPGFMSDPAKFKLAVVLTQVTMPYLTCMVIAALFSGTLNARGRFVISGFYPTLLNVIMLVAILPQKDPVTAAWAASIAVVFAGVSQAALVWWGAARAGVRVGVIWPRLTPEVKRLIRTATPAAFANSATQLNIVISGILASYVVGGRAWMALADRLWQLPLSLVGVAIGIALLPRLSQAFGTADEYDAKAAMDQALVWSAALTLPAAVALIVMPTFLIDALFAHGETVLHDAVQTGGLLLHYGWGVPAFVLLRILQPAYFARGDTRTPMITALVSVAVNAALAVALFYTIGLPGIAIATSAAAWVNAVQLWVILQRRAHYHADLRVVSKAGRAMISAAAMGLALYLLAHPFRPALEGLLGGKEVAVLATVAVGGLVYFAFLFATRAVTLAEARVLLRRRRKDPPPTPDVLS